MKIQFFSLLTIILLSGCSEKLPYSTATVSGTVTFQGKPLERGAVSFIPEPGTKGPATGGEIVDGAYVVKGIPLGTHRVYVAIKGETPGVTPGGRVIKEGPRLPKKYEEGIVTEVSENRQLDFEIPEAG